MTRVLMVSSNGTGVGHLTRLLAYARAMPRVQLRVLSLSKAAAVVTDLGYPVDYVPSQGALGMSAAPWRRLFSDRLAQAVREHAADLVVFDGPSPYPGFQAVRRLFPSTRWVWSRRGMWKPGLLRDQLDRAAWFDQVIEPGDLARAADSGATSSVAARRGVHQVAPVTLFDRTDLLPRDQARSQLQLPPDEPIALVSLGAGNINDTTKARQVSIAAAHELGYQVSITESVIADGPATAHPGVHPIRRYPLMRHLAAFDVVIGASGYNLFHEALRCGLPAIFIPNEQTKLDDQRARANYAHQQGWATCVMEPTQPTLVQALQRVIEQGDQLAQAALATDPGNGATQAARLMLEGIA